MPHSLANTLICLFAGLSLRLLINWQMGKLANMQVLTIGGGKGGTGKTTLTRNLAPLLAKTWRVLAVDADSQGGLTRSSGISPPPYTLADVMLNKRPLSAAIVDAGAFSLLGAGRELAEAELAIAGKIGRESILAKALATVATTYDVVLIDSGPSLGLMSINALAASTGVLCVVRPQAQDLAALGEYLQTVSDVKGAINPALSIVGIVANEYSGQMNHHLEAVEVLKRDTGAPMLGTVGRSVRLAEAAAGGLTLADYDRTNPRVDEIEQVTKAINKWLKNQQSHQ